MRLANMRAAAGEPEAAERLDRAAAEAANTNVLRARGRREVAGLPNVSAAGVEVIRLARRWGDASKDWDAAERLARQAADAGDTSSLWHLAVVAKAAGDREAAERMFGAALDAGNTDALTELMVLRGRARDWEAAERIARQAVEAGKDYVLTHLAKMREEAGDSEAAERLARQAADVGDLLLLPGLARKYWPYGLEADGAAAGPWVWPEPGCAPT
ncbi:hypothetical protein [Streptomyces avermitilis]|nr:hypothetical protein [Streptomyces avermitilis]